LPSFCSALKLLMSSQTTPGSTSMSKSPMSLNFTWSRADVYLTKSSIPSPLALTSSREVALVEVDLFSARSLNKSLLIYLRLWFPVIHG
jgi:hypothetical protein